MESELRFIRQNEPEIAPEKVELQEGDRWDIAVSLGLSWDQYQALQEKDRLDIEEFVVNANASLMRFFEDQSRSRLNRAHDWTHILDMVRRGKNPTTVAPSFIHAETGYEDAVLEEELYPNLFLGADNQRSLKPPDSPAGNYSHAIRDWNPATHQGTRRDLIWVNNYDGPGTKWQFPAEQLPSDCREVVKEFHRRAAELALSPVPGSSEELMQYYEKLLGIDTIMTLIGKVPDEKKREMFQRCFDYYDGLTDKTRPAHYKEFATKLFSAPVEDMAQITVDEVLAGVRSVPTRTS